MSPFNDPCSSAAAADLDLEAAASPPFPPLVVRAGTPFPSLPSASPPSPPLVVRTGTPFPSPPSSDIVADPGAANQHPSDDLPFGATIEDLTAGPQAYVFANLTGLATFYPFAGNGISYVRIGPKRSLPAPPPGNRGRSFRPDHRTLDAHRISTSAYKGSGYSRGHLTAAGGVDQYIRPEHDPIHPPWARKLFARMRALSEADPHVVAIDENRLIGFGRTVGRAQGINETTARVRRQAWTGLRLDLAVSLITTTSATAIFLGAPPTVQPVAVALSAVAAATAVLSSVHHGCSLRRYRSVPVPIRATPAPLSSYRVAVDSTYVLTNATPQVGHGLNNSIMLGLEYLTLGLAHADAGGGTVEIWTGPAFLPERPPEARVGRLALDTIADGLSDIWVPTHFFKLLVARGQHWPTDRRFTTLDLITLGSTRHINPDAEFSPDVDGRPASDPTITGYDVFLVPNRPHSSDTPLSAFHWDVEQLVSHVGFVVPPLTGVPLLRSLFDDGPLVPGHPSLPSNPA